MKCPQCQTDMKFVHKQFTYHEDGKEYRREMYQCVAEDIWITVEKPTGDQKKLA